MADFHAVLISADRFLLRKEKSRPSSWRFVRRRLWRHQSVRGISRPSPAAVFRTSDVGAAGAREVDVLPPLIEDLAAAHAGGECEQ